MKIFFAALALAGAVPATAHASDATAGKDCCDQMKAQEKKCCCCDDKARQTGAEHKQDHAGHEMPGAPGH